MQTYILTYSVGDGYTWSAEDVFVLEASSADDLMLHLHGHLVASEARYKEETALREKLRDTFIVGQKSSEKFFEALKKANLPPIGEVRTDFIYNGYNMAAVLSNTNSQTFWDDVSVEPLEDWVTKKKKERLIRKKDV